MPLEAAYSGDSLRITVNGKQLDVRVPKGIRPGQVIRLAGQGNHGGNLLLEVEYAAHPQFEVDGRNILYTLPLTPWQPRWAPASACRPWVVRWNSRFRPIPMPAASCLRGRGLPGNGRRPDRRNRDRGPGCDR